MFLADEKKLYRRFSAYDDKELLRILTVERAQYRDAALAAAEQVLMRRGVAPPTLYATPGPRAVVAGQATTRPKSPYQLIDFGFDALLFLLVCWAIGKLWAWTISSTWGLWGQLAFYALAPQLLGSAVALRRKWRAKQWN